MRLKLQRILTMLPVLLYWPVLFILAHIPIPKLVYRAQVSDKVIHFTAYLILTFLLCFAVCPFAKVNWRKKASWLILFTILIYGILDEVLQGFVGRTCDAMDYAADAAGGAACLVLLSFFSFWPAFLIVTAGVIFLLTNLAQANLSQLIPITDLVFHFSSYFLLTLIWARNLRDFGSLEYCKIKWVVTAVGGPLVFLGGVKLFSLITGRGFAMRSVIVSVVAVLFAVGAVWLFGLFKKRFNRRHFVFERSI